MPSSTDLERRKIWMCLPDRVCKSWNVANELDLFRQKIFHFFNKYAEARPAVILYGKRFQNCSFNSKNARDEVFENYLSCNGLEICHFCKENCTLVSIENDDTSFNSQTLRSVCHSSII